MDLGLTDRVAFVAAANQGLGLAVARELAREGAKVAFCGRGEENNARAAAELAEIAGDESRILALRGDVTMEADIQGVIGATVERFGGLDLLVTNAGGPKAGHFKELGPEDWGRSIRLTLLSATWLVRTALPHLERSPVASIVTITSISGKQPIDALLLSNVLRPAVIGLTKTLSQELAPRVRVNSVLPGWTRTDRVGELLADRAQRNGTSVGEEEGKVIAGHPMGRMADPEELGRATAFLLSPAASYLNGVMLPVDGGASKGLL